jgi:hypothetical protein
MSRFSKNEPLNFACSRRELPGKLFAIGLALLLPERRSEILDIPTKSQPKFKIGDLVAEDWPDENDKTATDFGQVLGMRYFDEAASCFPANSWAYYINWTYSTCGPESSYPNYDGEGTREIDLRLVKQS